MDEYGIEVGDKKLYPIDIDDIKSFNCLYNGTKTYNADFIDYIKKSTNAKLYITENENCKERDYIAKIIRIRDKFEIVSNVRHRLYENGTKVEKLSEQKLYECLSSQNPLERCSYMELCRYIDFKGITIAYFPEGELGLFHRIETEEDEKDGELKKIKATRIGYYRKESIVANYEWQFTIEGGNILKNRIKEVLDEDRKNQEIECERLENERKRREEEARREKFRYNQRNRHYRDANISFDETTHEYKVNGKILQSVTTFINNSFPKFDAEAHAKYQAAKMGKSIKEVLDLWEAKGKESRDLGTALHKKIENFYQGIDSEEDKAFHLFKIFADKIELKPYRTEWAVYDWEHKIAGTIDFVDYQNNEYIIYDWKRSDKLINNDMPVKVNLYHEKGNYPLEHLDNSPYNHYALQLSIYKFILERNYGIKISDLRLGIFHPTYNKPYVLKIPYLKKEIDTIFSLRSEVIF